MAGALECWSGRPSTDEEMVEQVLMKTQQRSEGLAAPPYSSAPNGKKWQRLGRNFAAGAIAALKSSLNLDTPRDNNPSSSAPTSTRFDRLLWGGVVRSLTQLYPGSQLPDRLISNIRRHFDSLPNSYAQMGYDMKQVLLHARLIEQAAEDDQPAVNIEAVADDDAVYSLTFASNSPLSWPAMSTALDSTQICCKKVHIFEKKGLTLGVVSLLVQPGSQRSFKSRIDAALKSAIKKPKTVKLHFGLCGCQEESSNNPDAGARFDPDDGDGRIQLPTPLPESSAVVSIDEWQTIRSGGEEIQRWLLNADEVEFGDRLGPNSFKGSHRGKRVYIKKLRGCERGSSYEVEARRDLLRLMSCGHRSILQLHGLCIDDIHGLCVVTRMVDAGSVHDAIQKGRKIPIRDVVRIAADVAEGLEFMNSHGVSYHDLNVQRILLLDGKGSACLGDMGVIVASCGNSCEVTEYETTGFRWLAPEIIAGDPESVTETWMSNVYSLGMVMWEMVTGEAAYSSYSPVQAAVGIAACGLRPDIPKNCPQVLASLMLRCWDNCPTNRPEFSEIIAILQNNGGI